MLQKNKALTLGMVVLVALAIVFVSMAKNGKTDAKTATVGTSVAATVEGGTLQMAEVTEPAEVKDESPAGTVEIDVEKALSKRAIGDENAPVVVEEYASLSCSHCAHFHETTLPALKEKYFDTGKVYFVFNDFPLNGPALHGAMVARCLPEQAYFKFVSFLFETQQKWAFEENYQQILEQNVKLLGMSGDKFNACLDNKDLQAGLIDIMQKAQSAHDINSTPSFIINGETVVTGAQSIEAFSKVIDPLLPAMTQEEKTEEVTDETAE